MFLHNARLSLVLVIALLAPGMVLAAPSAAPAAQPEVADSSILFIENAGQWPAAARFRLWGSPLGLGTTWLTEDAIWVTIANRSVDPLICYSFGPNLDAAEPQITSNWQGTNLKLSFLGGNQHPRLVPAEPADTTVSYFLGKDPAQWQPDVPVWHSVRYDDLYPAVDLEITSVGGAIELRLEARAGAPTPNVALQLEGAAVTGVEGRTLYLATSMGEQALPLPAANFDIIIHGAAENGTTSTWTVAPRDQPTTHTWHERAPNDNPADLLFSTFLGGSSYDMGCALAVDGAGNAFVSGRTSSDNFPTTPGAFDPSHNGSASDIFVVKLNPAGSQLAYATFLGGSGHDNGHGIAVGGAGSAYVTGWTSSTDFPTTPGAFDPDLGGNNDGFVVKLNASGSGLVYGTYLGGSRADHGYALAVDGAGGAYVTGGTWSTDFPTTPGAFDTTKSGEYDSFVVKLNLAGSGLIYGTYLGGSGDAVGTAIAVDGGGTAYVTGETDSNDFPTTSGAFDRSYNGGILDAFAARLNPAGSGLIYATFLGGSETEGIRHCDGWGRQRLRGGNYLVYQLSYHTGRLRPDS